MDKKINVLNIQLDDCTAKEAMKAVTEYMQTDPVNTIEIVNIEMLVTTPEEPAIGEPLEQMDLTLAGDAAILEAAGVTDKKRLQEASERVFQKMLLRYFHKNCVKVFFLADKEEKLEQMQEYLKHHYSGIEIVGSAIVPDDDSADDMILNTINGTEVECILASLVSPKQEEFIHRCRLLLNVRLWLGIGSPKELIVTEESVTSRIKAFLQKWFFHREVKRDQKKRSEIVDANANELKNFVDNV